MPYVTRNICTRSALAGIAIFLIILGALVFNRTHPTPPLTEPLATASTTDETQQALAHQNELDILQKQQQMALQQPLETWKIYENRDGYYRINYPDNVSIQTSSEEDRSSVYTSSSVHTTGPLDIITITGGNRLTAYTSTPAEYTKEEDAEYFARKARQQEDTERNINFPNKHTSEVERTMVGEQSAYFYDVIDSIPKDIRHLWITNTRTVLEITYDRDNPLSQRIVDTLELLDNNTTTVTPTPEWLSYENSAYHYELRYPPHGIGPHLSPFTHEDIRWNPLDRTQNIWIETHRGPMGVIVITAGYPTTQGIDTQLTSEEFLTLPLKPFTEALHQYQVNQIGRPSKFGPDTKQVGPLTQTMIGGHTAYSFSVAGTPWFETPINQFLVPSANDKHTYTIIENSQGTKFLLWHPSDDQYFNTIMQTFRFIE